MCFPSTLIFSCRELKSVGKTSFVQLCCTGASHVLHLCFLQEELCRWRMTWSSHSSCCFALWSSASSVALQNFSNPFTVSFRIVLSWNSYMSRRLTEQMFLYHSESAIVKVQSPPARAVRRSQSKAKSRPPEPEVDLQLLKTLCQENDCNSEEV